MNDRAKPLTRELREKRAAQFPNESDSRNAREVRLMTRRYHRDAAKKYQALLCEHGKTMCYLCLEDGGPVAEIDVIFTEYKSPGRIIQLDQETLIGRFPIPLLGRSIGGRPC